MDKTAFLLGVLLCASATLAIPPAGAQFQEVVADDDVISYDFATAQGWTTATNAADPATGTAWRLAEIDGDLAFAATNLEGGDHEGYDNDALATLTSPMIDLTSHRIEGLGVAVKGSSEEDADILSVQVRPEFEPGTATGESRWRTLATFSGEDLAGDFAAQDLTAELLATGFAHDNRFQIRFLFAADADCDSEPPAGPDPEAGSPGDDDYLACDGVGPFDGWFVDDVQLTVRGFQLDDVIHLVDQDLDGTASLTVSPDSDAAQSWHKVQDGPGDQAYYTAAVDGGEPAGYANDVDTSLTSPVLDTSGFRLRSLTFDVHGTSEADADELLVQMKRGSHAWETLAAYSGAALAGADDAEGDPARDGAYTRIDLREDQAFALLAGHDIDKSFQFRFRFVSDDLCDSEPARAPEDPPSANPDPGGPDPGVDTDTGDPDWPDCDGVGPFEGWFVDNIVLDAWIIPANVPAGAIILPFNHPNDGASISSVHAATDANKFIGFDLDKTAVDAARTTPLPAFQSARVEITHSSGDVLRRSLQRVVEDDGSIHWRTALPVNHPDLLLGANQVTFRYTLGDGTTAAFAARALTVGGTDTAAPTIAAVETSPQVINANGIVRVVPTDMFLRGVTYKLPSMDAPAPLGAPYILRSQQFVEGTQTVEFKVTDRAGKSNTLTHVVVKDTIAPEVNMTMPDRFYQGIPYTVDVDVEDATPARVTLRIGNETRIATAQVGQGASFDETPSKTGTFAVELTVRDAAGNRHIESRTITVEQVEADIAIDELTASAGPFLAGDSVTIMATLTQDEGLIDIPTNVTFAAPGGNGAVFQQTVPANGTADLTWSTSRLAPGRQTISAALSVPDAVIELDGSNDRATVDIEVFLGRTDHGDTSYYIRVSDVFGLPLEAVDIESGSTFRLQVPDASTERVYRFNDGDLQLYWDPLSPITTIPLDETEPSPGVGLFGVLALLGAAVAMRRRE